MVPPGGAGDRGGGRVDVTCLGMFVYLNIFVWYNIAIFFYTACYFNILPVSKQQWTIGE